MRRVAGQAIGHPHHSPAMRRIAVIVKLLNMRHLFLYLWTSPNTLVGLMWVLLARLTGGGWSVHTGVVEAHGGWVKPILQRLPFVKDGALAITIGHVVLAQTEAALSVTREHERVHVRQYQRWGPLFVLAYVGAGVWMWARGKDPYRDNPFEVEAYGVDK
ncbi:MAG: hypothetical protein AAF711_05940 [Planctomycetota bacterium]